MTVWDLAPSAGAGHRLPEAAQVFVPRTPFVGCRPCPEVRTASCLCPILTRLVCFLWGKDPPRERIPSPCAPEGAVPLDPSTSLDAKSGRQAAVASALALARPSSRRKDVSDVHTASRPSYAPVTPASTAQHATLRRVHHHPLKQLVSIFYCLSLRYCHNFIIQPLSNSFHATPFHNGSLETSDARLITYRDRLRDEGRARK